jgi:uncharacterized OB-fold protein
MTDEDRPTPATPEELTTESPLTLPGFFDALSDGRLLGGECADCGQVLLPPRPACDACGSRAIAVAEQSRTGSIYSHTEVRNPPPALEADAPYTLAVVDLDGGGRLTGRVDATYDTVAIGDRVELVAREPTTAQREASLSSELDWPLHVFEPR